jgi:hypothetical protein
MITLEIKTTLDKDDEQKFLNNLLKAIDEAEYQLRNSSKLDSNERFVRSVGVGTK